MPGNPYGAVIVGDGNAPRIFTGIARQTVSGGDFVFVSGAVGLVSSGADSFNPVTDYTIGTCTADASTGVIVFNGIALNNAASGGVLSVARRGDFITLCGGSVFGGTLIEIVSGTTPNSVQTLSSGGSPAGLHLTVPGAKIAGRAVTAGTSGGFAIVSLWG